MNNKMFQLINDINTKLDELNRYLSVEMGNYEWNFEIESRTIDFIGKPVECKSYLKVTLEPKGEIEFDEYDEYDD